MAIPLRLVLLEDNPSDAQLMLHALRRAGYDPIGERMETELAFREQLKQSPEVILSDYSMPGFDALRVIEIVQEHGLDIPVIVVSGSIGEERAVQIMQRGATDYIVKDRLGRLGLAVTQALQHKTLRQSARRTEVALTESEVRFKQVADCMPAIVFSARPDGYLDYYNKRWSEFTGVAEGAGGDNSWIPVLHPDDLQACRDSWYAAIKSGLPYDQEFRFKEAKTGLYRWQLARALPVRDAAGKIVRWYGSCTDIHMQKLAEESDRRLASIVESSQDAITSETLDGKILTWNKAAETIYGYTAAEMVGESSAKLFPPDRSNELANKLAVLKSGEKIHQLDTIRVKKDGTHIPVSLSVSPVNDHAGRITAISVIARDSSERKRLEEQLRQSQKMDAIGRLAGGVAHDFNNLLTVILGRAELVNRNSDLPQSVLRSIKLIHETASRAAVLTKQLLQFSRQQLLQPKIVDINGLLPEMQELLSRLIGEDIDLRLTLTARGCKIKVDPGQIQQVIMNLVINARDAMPNGGKLTIETRSVELDAEYCREHPEAKPGPHMLLAVSDTGCGMDEKVRAQIFEPFFTTKELGKGTGLGLSTVYGAVKQAGGNIYVYSEVNHGTTFKVYFPEITERAHTPISSEALHPVRGGGETILLVEDEDGIRELLQEILTEKGYMVLVAEDGERGIVRGESHPATIHLLLTDVVMPKVNGNAMAQRLLQTRPDMKVLYMSGYTSQAIVSRGVLDEGIEFLEKPFTPTSVAKRVREVIDSTTPPVKNNISSVTNSNK